MPFETVPVKLTGREFEREVMIRHLVKNHGLSDYKLRQMSDIALRGYYKLSKTLGDKNGRGRNTRTGKDDQGISRENARRKSS